MSNSGGSKSVQGGGELSGLLRHAEALQHDLERALADLKNEVVEGQDATRQITIRVSGDGSAKEVRIQRPGLSEAERRALEESLTVALRIALDRMFELRKKRATIVTKGLTLPGLFT